MPFTQLTKDTTPAEALAAFEGEIDAGRWPCIEGSVCRYRGPRGNACAIGMFIPDKMAAELDKTGLSLRNADVAGLVEPYLPEWMHGERGRFVQQLHDLVANTDDEPDLPYLREAMRLELERASL